MLLTPFANRKTTVAFPEVRTQYQMWTWLRETVGEQVFTPGSDLWKDNSPKYGLVLRQQRVKSEICGRMSFVEVMGGGQCYPLHITKKNRATHINVGTNEEFYAARYEFGCLVVNFRIS